MKKIIQKINTLIILLFGAYRTFFLYHVNEKRFVEKFMDPTFDWKKFRHQYNPYFLKYGFKFPMYECEYYAACSGVKSELYLPITFYVRYIFPYLNHTGWRWGYSDKNMISRFLDIKETEKHVDIKLPECVCCCDNGRFFKNGTDESCSLEDAVHSVLQTEEDLIIKPSVQTCHGKGVVLISNSEKVGDKIVKLFCQYGNNFVVQKKILQHEELAKLNPTSVNTIRIVTYWDFNGKIKILFSTQRFGGSGKVYDNADTPDASGGFCAIKEDGTYVRDVHHFRNMNKTHLSDDITDKVPYFDKVKEAVLYLHTRFPHYALIGWDVSVTLDGHPILLEYNFMPGLGTCQLAHGPMFGKEDLDEIMKRVSKGRIIRKSNHVILFRKNRK